MTKINNIRLNRTKKFYFVCSERAAEALVSKKLLRIHPKFEKIIIALRTPMLRI